jgi:hypothetical protein
MWTSAAKGCRNENALAVDPIRFRALARGHVSNDDESNALRAERDNA